MNQFVKIGIIRVMRLFLKLLYMLPVRENKVFFNSYEGRQFSCNPKYIFLYMYHTYGSRFRYVWCLNDRRAFSGEYTDIPACKFMSIGYFVHSMTSKYVISNFGIEPFLPLRKKQVVINTWHGGGAYKRLITSYAYKRKLYAEYVREIRARETSYIVSSCERRTNCFSEDMNMPKEKFLPFGMPRNDILFRRTDYKDRIAEQYGFDKEKKIILYAPTFRGDHRSPLNIPFMLDSEALLKTVESTFKCSFLLLYRTHYFYSSPGNENNPNVISVTGYPDMQELLSAANILITDYSSSMWDFSFTGKPCFIFAPDLDTYQTERDFYTPVSEWPFPVARTNDALCQNILDYDDGKYRTRIENHHKELGSYETGHATEQFCTFIFGRIL